MNDVHPPTTQRSARLARARRIRRRIIGGAVALFVATWLLITIVLVSGHDPALAKRASETTVASTPATTTATTTTSSSASGAASSSSGAASSSSGETSSSSNTGSAGVSSVTTSQS